MNNECELLIDIVFPDNVVCIGSGTFSRCTSLTGITIPAGVSDFGSYAFTGCKNLNVAVVSSSYAEQYCRENNISYTCIESLDWLNN